MPIWDDYHRGLYVLSYALNHLQADRAGFRDPLHPERLGVGRGCLSALWNGVFAYAETRSEFAPLALTVQHDYFSPDTNPDTFQQPIYYKLREIIDDQLRTEGLVVVKGQEVPSWTVWRQDDNGGRFLIEANLTEEQTQAMVKEFEAKGHKQTYWCNSERTS